MLPGGAAVRILCDGVDLPPDGVLVDGNLGVLGGPLGLDEVLVHPDDPGCDEGKGEDCGADDDEADDFHPCCCLPLS